MEPAKPDDARDEHPFVTRFLDAVKQEDPQSAWLLLRQELDEIQKSLNARAGKPVPKSYLSLYDYLWPKIDYDSGEQGVAFEAALYAVADRWCDGEGESRAFGEALRDRSAENQNEREEEELAFVGSIAGHLQSHLKEVLTRLYRTERAVENLESHADDTAEAVRAVSDRLTELLRGNARLANLLETTRPIETPQSKLTMGEKGVILLLKDPSLNTAEIARRVGCHPSTLTRSDLFKRFLDALSRDPRELPSGFRHRETGQVEAWEE
jgi:hypothetical protein